MRPPKRGFGMSPAMGELWNMGPAYRGPALPPTTGASSLGMMAVVLVGVAIGVATIIDCCRWACSALDEADRSCEPVGTESEFLLLTVDGAELDMLDEPELGMAGRRACCQVSEAVWRC